MASAPTHAKGQSHLPALIGRRPRHRVRRRQGKRRQHVALAQKSDAKFKAAQAKAKRDGVHTLTQKDIEGLSVAQLKQIRGY